MIRKTDEVNKQMAELEYKNYEIKELIKTEQGFKVGSILDVNDNRSGNWEQIYAIASDGSNVLPNSPSNERVKVKEITL